MKESFLFLSQAARLLRFASIFTFDTPGTTLIRHIDFHLFPTPTYLILFDCGTTVLDGRKVRPDVIESYQGYGFTYYSVQLRQLRRAMMYILSRKKLLVMELLCVACCGKTKGSLG